MEISECICGIWFIKPCTALKFLEFSVGCFIMNLKKYVLVEKDNNTFCPKPAFLPCDNLTC